MAERDPVLGAGEEVAAGMSQTLSRAGRQMFLCGEMRLGSLEMRAGMQKYEDI